MKSQLNRIGIISLCMVLGSALLNPALAFERCYSERVSISQSSAEIPTPIQRPKPVTPLECARPFLYRGEVYSTDSPQSKDAANLRSFVKSVPEADALLDTYQNNRRLSRLSAYTGTLGLLAFIVSLRIKESNPELSKILRWSGLGLTAGGFVYSFTLLRSNESRIPQAVEKYNQANPNDPIELQFSAGWSF